MLNFLERDLKNLLHPTKAAIYYFEGRRPYPTLMFPNNKLVVVRQYSHGGLLRFFTRDLFLFGARSFEELVLTENIRLSGIPTITPVAAVHQILIPPFYRPYLLTFEVPGALNLIQYLKNRGSRADVVSLLHKRKIIQSAGSLLRRFHQAGFYHIDLQLKNLLVSGDEVLIIDFDRSYRKAHLSTNDRIKNLLRLYRSVEKWKELGVPISQTDCLRFLHAYADKDERILEEMRKALRFYLVSLFFHRLTWKIQKVFKKLRRGSLRN